MKVWGCEDESATNHSAYDCRISLAFDSSDRNSLMMHLLPADALIRGLGVTLMQTSTAWSQRDLSETLAFRHGPAV